MLFLGSPGEKHRERKYTSESIENNVERLATGMWKKETREEKYFPYRVEERNTAEKQVRFNFGFRFEKDESKEVQVSRVSGRGSFSD